MAILLSCHGDLLADTTPDPVAMMAEALAAYQHGDLATATRFWGQAADQFEAQGHLSGQIRARRNQALALQQRGYFEQSLRCLDAAANLARKLDDRSLLIAVYNDLGGLASLTRNGSARAYLEQAFEIATEDQDAKALAQIHNNLGHLLSTQGQNHDALEHYLTSADLARQMGQPIPRSRALANAVAIAIQFGDLHEALNNLQTALETLRDCPKTFEKSRILLAIGDRAICAIHKIDHRNDLHASFVKLADVAANQAHAATEQLVNKELASQTMALKGQLSEVQGDYRQALMWTRRAAFVAQQAQSPHDLYRMQWQTGRLLHAVGDTDEALATYRRAVDTLESVRADVFMGYGNHPANSDFRSEVSSLYYGLADLLLQKARAINDPRASKQHLIEARAVVERLKAAEMIDYFQDHCLALLEAQQTRIEDISPGTAVIYFIPLPDRLELLFSLPNSLKQFTVQVSQHELISETKRFHYELQSVSTHLERQHAQRLFNWLIAPIAGELKANKIDTLVFVPDGPLRTIPMAALHDGQRFLVEQYAVAVTPGLTLTAPRPFTTSRHRLLAAGLSQAVHGFGALPHVRRELSQVTRIFGGQTLLDERFVAQRLQDEVSRTPYSILHIASHGHFGSTIEDTFILTYDTKLTLSALGRLIGPARFRDRPLELLTLSACETASGNDKAALGLAGIALRFGTRSALATLWTVQDEATALIIGDFYQHLVDYPADSKAKALQAAQIRWIRTRDDDPFFWSQYLIIGNWL